MVRTQIHSITTQYVQQTQRQYNFEVRKLCGKFFDRIKNILLLKDAKEKGVNCVERWWCLFCYCCIVCVWGTAKSIIMYGISVFFKTINRTIHEYITRVI